MSELTEKQEAFARAYVETGNASEAYRLSYDCADSSEKTVNEEACKLLKHPKIAPRVANLRAAHQKRHEITVDKLTEWLKEAMAKAMAEPKGASAAVSAVMGIGKLHGLVIDKAEVTRKRDASDASDAELIAIARLGREGGSAPSLGPSEPDIVH